MLEFAFLLLFTSEPLANAPAPCRCSPTWWSADSVNRSLLVSRAVFSPILLFNLPRPTFAAREARTSKGRSSIVSANLFGAD